MASSGRVGFCGLGVMGRQMASALIEQGFKVHVWNRSSNESLRALQALGAVVCSSPEAVARECPLTFGMVADPAASRAIAFQGTNSIDKGMRKGAAYVDCSTVDAQASMETMAAIKAAGGSFLAAPVSGGWRDAKAGKLLFICGGDEQVYEQATESMEAMGEKRWLVGSTPDKAAHAKLVLQVMMGNMIGALGEAMAVADAAGIDADAVGDMLDASAMGNPLIRAKAKLMSARDYSPNFQVYLQQKDLHLVAALSDELQVPTPITSAANNMYVQSMQRGFGNQDFAAVREAYRAP